jgi:hypothetical protein
VDWLAGNSVAQRVKKNSQMTTAVTPAVADARLDGIEVAWKTNPMEHQNDEQ